MPTSQDGAAESAASPPLLGEKGKVRRAARSLSSFLMGSANASSSLQSKRPVCSLPAQGREGS